MSGLSRFGISSSSLSSGLQAVKSNVGSANQYLASGQALKDSAQFINSAIVLLKQLFNLAKDITTKYNSSDNRNKIIEFIKSFFVKIGQLINSLKSSIKTSTNMSFDEQALADKFLDSIFSLFVLIAVLFGAGGVFNKGGKKRSKTIKYNKSKNTKKRVGINYFGKHIDQNQNYQLVVLIVFSLMHQPEL